jgi:hypothetical protein
MPIPYKPLYPTATEAVAAWNRRAPCPECRDWSKRQLREARDGWHAAYDDANRRAADAERDAAADRQALEKAEVKCELLLRDLRMVETNRNKLLDRIAAAVATLEDRP